MPFMPVVGNICSNRFTINWICFAVLETIFGYDFEETNYVSDTFDAVSNCHTLNLLPIRIKLFTLLRTCLEKL